MRTLKRIRKHFKDVENHTIDDNKVAKIFAETFPDISAKAQDIVHGILPYERIKAKAINCDDYRKKANIVITSKFGEGAAYIFHTTRENYPNYESFFKEGIMLKMSTFIYMKKLFSQGERNVFLSLTHDFKTFHLIHYKWLKYKDCVWQLSENENGKVTKTKKLYLIVEKSIRINVNEMKGKSFFSLVSPKNYIQKSLGLWL